VAVEVGDGKAELRPEHGARQLRDELLGGVGGRSEAVPEIAPETARMTGPVGVMPISA
jgi:hypothetical protein